VDGKKVSGNSQHTNMRRMLSHGTLLFDSELEFLQHVLDSNLAITQSRAVSSIQSRVTNISEHLRHPMGMDAFRSEMVGGISDAFGKLGEYRMTAEDRKAVQRLATEKYKSWDWTFGRSPEFAVRHKIKLNSGHVDAHLIVNNGIIKDIQMRNHSADSSSIGRIRQEFIGQCYDLKFAGNKTVKK
jgi:lipoate-protein ligase A